MILRSVWWTKCRQQIANSAFASNQPELGKREGSWQSSHLKRLSEEGPLLHFCPLDALQTELHLLTCGSLHVQEEVQQRANQPSCLGLGDGVQEGADILQQAPELWKKPRMQKKILKFTHWVISLRADCHCLLACTEDYLRFIFYNNHAKGLLSSSRNGGGGSKSDIISHVLADLNTRSCNSRS